LKRRDKNCVVFWSSLITFYEVACGKFLLSNWLGMAPVTQIVRRREVPGTEIVDLSGVHGEPARPMPSHQLEMLVFDLIETQEMIGTGIRGQQSIERIICRKKEISAS
jgi:hypothetical protein